MATVKLKDAIASMNKQLGTNNTSASNYAFPIINSSTGEPLGGG